MESNISSSHNKLPREHRGSFANNIPVYLIIAVAAALLYSMLSWLTPYSLDDWTFMGNWRDDAGNKEFSFSGWWNYYEFVRGYDNGRLSNAFSPFSTLLSPWKEVFPILTGSLLSLSMVLLQRFVTGSRSSLYLVVIWGLMIVCLPWYDTLFVRDYSLNYIWSAALTLGFLYFLKKGETAGWSPRLLILCLLLAVLASGWHESFAIATLFGLGILMLLRRFRFTIQFYSTITVYLTSTIIFMVSPGMLGRIQKTASDIVHLPYGRAWIVLCLLFVSFLPYLITRRGRASIRRVTGAPVVVTGLGILFAGYLIAILSDNTPRSYFWPNLAGVCVIVYLIANYPSKMTRMMRRLITTIIAFLCIFQTSIAIVWQARYADETAKIMDLLDKSDTGTVFYDLTLPQRPPRYTFGMPFANAWTNPYHYHALWSYYITPVIGVVPTDLKDANVSDEWPTDSKSGRLLYKVHLIGPFENEDSTRNLKLPAYAGDYLAVPFINMRGDTLMYYRER